ncbi:MAG: amidohydrolase family protein [Holophagales bacterium]|nr:amidohydrolase family protein [Holophagales bacterium]MYG29181.1 amidohydrolase family protein [Holophagales bacterium]MYI81249.1 amidohydrolase family protein [Holophagales bacterium]
MRAIVRNRQVLVLAVGLAAAPLLAGPPPEPPPFYAIEGVRVEVGDGTVLERATVVIENGTIAAVAEDAAIPAHAWVIDGEGLTVYPGLIDAMGSLPQPRRPPGVPGAAAPGGQRRRPDPDRALPRGPEDRPLTTPWKRAADDLRLDAEAVETWRKAGVTSIAATPGDGLFPGRLSLVRLGAPGRDPEHQVIAPELAQVASLSSGGGFGSYPGALMGRVAYFRQLLLDAAHYAAVTAAYEADPSGWRRPEFDRTLAPLAAVGSGEERILLPGSSAVEINRALRLGEELGLDFALYGGQEGYRLAGELADSGVAVLVDVDWPEPLPERDRDPDADRPLREILHERLAPTTPVELAEAGVQFALSSGGANGADDFLAGVRRAIEGGLEPARALQALTRDAAAVHGLDDRIGTVATGMAADLVLADGYPWRESTRVEAVFIDGVRYAVSDGEEAEDDAENGESAREGESAGEPDETRPRGRRGPGGRGGSSEAAAPMRLAEVASKYAEVAGDSMVPMTGPYREDDVLAITGATVLTMAGETIENGTVVVRDGRIARVGSGVRPPRGAHVIDADGGYLMPGIFDAHSHISTAGGVNEGSLAVTAMVRIEDVVDPTDVAIYRALAGGVTTVNILHGSANPIGGQNQVLKLRWGQDADGMRFEGAPPGIKFALGENPKRSRSFGPGPRRYPATRMGVLDVIREAFTEAAEYRDAWARHREAEAAGERSRPPVRDLELEALVEILEGERLVHAHSYRADEILQLLRLAEELGFRIATLQHVLEGYRVADEIAAHGAGASTFSDWWAYKVEAYEAIPHNAALMADRGVLVSVNSDDAEEMRHLNHEAAKAVKWGGLSDDAALALVTINPARQFGIDDRVGSIEVGKDADLVIYDRHPLSSYAVVQTTLVDGKVYFDRELDRLRREQLAALERSLTEPADDDGGDEP